MEEKLTHFNEEGRARMVDVSEKAATARQATAKASVRVNAHTYGLIREGKMKKGDVLAVAQVAGIMGAKRTPDVIPMCHPIALTGVDIRFQMEDETCTIHIFATARCTGQTGVEMEAMTAASVAALTIYDMCKAVQRDIEIESVYLLEKSGGKSGLYRWEDKHG
jgi:cyclic pyranopterin phosphate synthase